MTIFGIGGCMALMLVGFGLKDSIFEITQLQYTDIQVYKGIVYLQDNVTDEEKAELSEYLDDLDGVEQYMDTRMQSITLVNGKKERATVECVMKDTDRIPEYVQFRDRVSHEGYTLEDDGVILSEKTAKLLDVGVGDTIYIKDEENGNIPIKISHICENYMGHYVYFTPTYYEEVYGEAPEYNSILFKTPEDYTNEQVEDVGTDIIADEAVLSISYMHDIQEQLDDMLGSLNLVIIVLIVSAGMLAFVVLYNLNNINITERQRELATLKVLGFYDPEVGMYVYRENLLLTLIGAVVGAGLGKVLHRFIIETVEVDAAMFGRVINFSSYVYSLLFTLAFAVIVNAVMYFKLKKIDMVESLKSIE
jgi:putative ABC transport system permease protein